MSPTARVHGTGVIHRQRAGAGNAVAQHQIAIEAQLGAVGQPHRLPVLETAHACGLDVAQVELVDATATVEQRHRTQVALVEVAEVGDVVVRAHVDRAVDNATAAPVEGVIAGTEQYLPAHGPVGDGHAVVAAADADVAADIGRARNDDGVGVEAGHHVAINSTAGLVPQVLVQLHVDAADAACGHPGLVAIFERTDDAATAHAEGIDVVALLQRADRAATHDEIIAATALRHHAGDGAAGDGHLVIAATLVDAVDGAIAQQQHIVAISLQDAAADAAGLHLEAIIAGAELHTSAPDDRSAVDQHAVAGANELQGRVVAGADAAGVFDAAATTKLDRHATHRTDRAEVGQQVPASPDQRNRTATTALLQLCRAGDIDGDTGRASGSDGNGLRIRRIGIAGDRLAGDGGGAATAGPGDAGTQQHDGRDSQGLQHGNGEAARTESARNGTGHTALLDKGSGTADMRYCAGSLPCGERFR